MELSIPTHFRCPISLDLMTDPVTVPTGITYDRHSIETWLDTGNPTCPVTNQSLNNDDLIPNHSLTRMIQDWCVTHHSFGIERIPTPKIPVTHLQVCDLLSELASASKRGDLARCSKLVTKINSLCRESERNKRCFVSNGAGRVLAASFSTLAGGPVEVSERILSALVTAMLPLDDEACSYMASPSSLARIVSISNSKRGDLAGRLSAVLVLKELASNKDLVNVLAETEGLIESLVELVKKPISPHATKASLVATYYLISSNQKVAPRFADMDLVPSLLEILVDSDKSLCEKALGVLDGICSSEVGRERASSHALTVPVIVKKMFRVSDVATEFVVSALWKLCRGRARGCLVEALQVGTFQKLLLLLQVGCSGATKEKATDLLKLLNGFKGTLDCIDHMDHRGLKKPL